jgi:hypothetical protein
MAPPNAKFFVGTHANLGPVLVGFLDLILSTWGDDDEPVRLGEFRVFEELDTAVVAGVMLA